MDSRRDAPTWRALRDDGDRRLATVCRRRCRRTSRPAGSCCEATGFDRRPARARATSRSTCCARARGRRHGRRRASRVSRCSTCSGAGRSAGSTSWSIRRVLIPRPETEVVAQVAIDELVRRWRAAPGRPIPWSAGVTDLLGRRPGHRSGALALALVTALPDAAVWATDASDDALAVAARQRGEPRLSGDAGPRRGGRLVRRAPDRAARGAAAGGVEPALRRRARSRRRCRPRSSRTSPRRVGERPHRAGVPSSTSWPRLPRGSSRRACSSARSHRTRRRGSRTRTGGRLRAH